MGSPFSDAEKRFILSEMIKASHMDVGSLCEFITRKQVQPDWFAMQLPSGRNMHQCLEAAEAMLDLQHPRPTAGPSLNPKPFGDMSETVQRRPAPPSPLEQHSLPSLVNPPQNVAQPISTVHRSSSDEFGRRAKSPPLPLQTRQSPPFQSTIARQSAAIVAQPRRKRGRPTKEKDTQQEMGCRRKGYRTIAAKISRPDQPPAFRVSGNAVPRSPSAELLWPSERPVPQDSVPHTVGEVGAILGARLQPSPSGPATRTLGQQGPAEPQYN